MRTIGLKKTLAASLALAACFVGLVGCTSSSSDDPVVDPDSVTLGLLLPFTGADSATSSNFERGALYAAKRVNDGGGISGKRLRIVSRDTHSELAAGEQSAQWLVDSGAKVVIGPESAALAPALYPMLTQNGVALLSPLVGAGPDPTFDCSMPWFRLAPSAKAMGEHLAKLIVAQKVSAVAIIYADDAYNAALSEALRGIFVSRGGSVPLELEVAANAQSYAGTVQAVVQAGLQSVVLATSARAGALLVNEFDALSSGHLRWFLSPQLKTELLVANVAPDALEGALGVAPQIFDTSSDFPDAFAREWGGDRPLEGAYFYYDAVALLSFALQKAATEPGSVTLAELSDIVRDVAKSPGEYQKWNEVEIGLSRIREGDDIYYTGLTGPMLLGQCGDRLQGMKTDFAVENGRIVDKQ
ncbi:MAG: ABC transporter substrate-binding protein [Myxococcales bacterium]